MFSNRLAFTALAVACVTAAAGGAFLATRQNVATEKKAAIEAPAPVEAAAKPVQETEAVVSPAPAAAPAPASSPIASKPAPAPAARKRDEARPPARPQGKPAENTTARNSQLPTLDHGWPSTPAPAQAPSAPPVEQFPPVPATPVEDRSVPEPPRAQEPPQKLFEERTVAADSVIGVRMETTVSSETAKVEDKVEARVVRDVRAGGEVAIPAGSRLLGTVVTVERGGKFKEQGRLGIRFNTLVLADGTRLPITTETITRMGEPRGQSSAARIGGGAVVGAILGAIAGGAKGAAIGGAVGGGAGTATVVTRDPSEATLKSGDEVTARILSPVTVTIEK
jgi:type IV secretory pathway VirB10-like protein